MRLERDRAEVTVCGTATGLSAPATALVVPLGLQDVGVVNAIAGGTSVIARGAGKNDPDGETHPAVKALRVTLDHFGASQVGVQLHLNARIPRGRGLGSHSADTLLGVLAAHQLVDQTAEEDTVVSLCLALCADELRVRSIMRASTLLRVGAEATFVPLSPPPLIEPVAFVPDFAAIPTQASLPRLSEDESNQEAARVGLLTLLLSGTEVAASEEEFFDLLMSATSDPRGQSAIEAAAPSSAALLAWLRGNGIPAVRSGTGSAVMSLTAVDQAVTEAAERSGWNVLRASTFSAGRNEAPGL